MRPRRLSSLVTFALLGAIALSAQDWRGTGALAGFVKSPDGQPVGDATVVLTRPKGGGPSTKTNPKGYWSVAGLAGGAWNVDVTAKGYDSRRLSVMISEGSRVPPMQIQIQKAAPAAAVQSQAQPDLGAEVKAAVVEGNRLLGEKKYAPARAEYEKALAMVPDNAALWKGIAQTYHGEGNKAKTEETLRKVAQLDPADTESRLLLANLLIEEGKTDEGKTMIDALPPGSIKDPAVYTNLGIIFMNQKRPDDARAYMTRAIEIDPSSAEGYYYRGLASMQAKKKNAEAKADFLKYLELAPNGPESKEVKEMLQALR